MNYDRQVQVFDDAQLIRDTVRMLCTDRLLYQKAENRMEDVEKKDAITQLCGEILTLQGRTFDFRLLSDKCGSFIQRTRYQPLKRLKGEDLANEIRSPVGGW